MEKIDELPKYSPVDHYAPLRKRRQHKRLVVRLVALACLSYITFSVWQQHQTQPKLPHEPILSQEKLEADYLTCAKLRSVPKDPSGPRTHNARHVPGQPPILIRNATVWTGSPKPGTTPEQARKGIGYEWIPSCDVLLSHGLITRVEPNISLQDLPEDTQIFDAKGHQLTAGIVDMHSHAGVDGLPELSGESDTNEMSSDITPYIRSLDGLNPLDHQIQVIKSGGVTTSLILPGSANNMGGEAFVIKHAVGQADGRPELSVEDLLADPERNWRYMKMACGENPKSVYGVPGRDFGPVSRLGEAWEFRHAFERAKEYVERQDGWCRTAERIGARNMGGYLPRELRWETLGAALRGQVLVNTHCYTVPDLEGFVGFTNEFEFEVRAFHHAHQTFLIPEVLKRAYGGRTPAAALFADNMNYKAEAYTFSEQAGQILYEAGITPVYVSDNPVINAQHVKFEAAKAYRNGLPYHVALAGVTSASAELLGLGERIGKVKPGFDADIAVWDSDPLSVGAAPIQVFIDGFPQFKDPVVLKKPLSKPLISSEQIPRPDPEKHEDVRDVILTGITKVLLPGMTKTYSSSTANAVISNGSITCLGTCSDEITTLKQLTSNISTIALKQGHIVPPATIFGSFLGLEEIQAEDSTRDGGNTAKTFSSALDGLSPGPTGKNLAAAYARGVTKAISAPSFGSSAGLKGLSVGFRIRAPNALEPGAIFSRAASVHYTLTPDVKDDDQGIPSISYAISELRKKLLVAASHLSSSNSSSSSSPPDPWTLSEETSALIQVLNSSFPLVISVHSADVISSLLRLKSDLESLLPSSPSSRRSTINLILHGGAESHLLAPHLAAANVSVLLAKPLAYAESWDQRRTLSGAPLTNGTAVDVLHDAGVKVALGTGEDWEVRDLWLAAGIALRNGNGGIKEEEAVGFISGNVYSMLGLEEEGGEGLEGEKEGIEEFVVFDGSPFEIEGQVRGVADGGGEVRVWWT